jgi:hypothetical protein
MQDSLEIPYNYGKKRNLTILEIRDYYPNLAKFKEPLLLSRYDDIYNEQVLNEFLTKTIDKKITLNQLKQRYNTKFDKFYTYLDGDFGLWIDFKEDQYKNIKEVNKFMLSFGWYPAFISNEQVAYKDFDKIKHTENHMLINYLEKFDAEKDITQYDYLWHVTPDISIDKIKDIGLTPKNKSKLSNNPKRIYFLLPTEEYNIVSTIKDLHLRTPKLQQKLIKSWYILKVNIKSLPDYLKFYKDPMFDTKDGAVWTFQNIPPKFIQIHKKINIINK